jgi:hypothetical protein
VPAQARPIYACRAGGPTGRKLRPGPSPTSGRASPAHIISCRTVLWALIFGPCSCWPEKPGPDSQHYLKHHEPGSTDAGKLAAFLEPGSRRPDSYSRAIGRSQPNMRNMNGNRIVNPTSEAFFTVTLLLFEL